jgi:hypothetical protein
MSTQPNLTKKSTAAETGAVARASLSPDPAEIAAQTSVEECSGSSSSRSG